MDGHAMLLPFDTDSVEFVRGFELGRIWALLRVAPEEPVEELAHVVNAEMLMRLGEATGREVTSEEIGDGWLLASFAPANVVAE
jgi:hypothetical protein